MKIKLLVAAAATVLATGAFAQAKSFEGFTVGVNGSFVGNTTQLSGSGDSNVGDSNFIPSGELGYAYAVTDKFVVALTGTYDFMESNAGKLTSTYQLKGKNHYSVNLKPGYALSKEAMVYAIIGYNQLTGSITNVSGSTNFTGVGYGLGAQLMLTSNVYAKVEMQQIQYGSQGIVNTQLNAKPVSNVGTFGVGYKF
jgi:opacity protein-like surface antigen